MAQIIKPVSRCVCGINGQIAIFRQRAIEDSRNGDFISPLHFQEQRKERRGPKRIGAFIGVGWRLLIRIGIRRDERFSHRCDGGADCGPHRQTGDRYG